MAKTKPNVPADKLALYDALIDANSQVLRKGAANPYTSLNGHMFSFMDKVGALSLRLDKAEREAFLVEFDTQLSVQYNSVMKEYVVVPDALLHDTPSLIKYFDMSFHYVGSLKPKPSKNHPLTRNR